VKDENSMLQKFFSLVSFPTRYGGSVIYEGMKTAVEYHAMTDGYNIVAKYHGQISITGK